MAKIKLNILKTTAPAGALPGMKRRSPWHKNPYSSYTGMQNKKEKANNKNFISMSEVSESMGVSVKAHLG